MSSALGKNRIKLKMTTVASEMEGLSYLKVWLRKASRHRDHGGGERPRDADGGEELGDVWRQAKWNRPVGVQLAAGVVDVKAEIRDVQLPCVLELAR